MIQERDYRAAARGLPPRPIIVNVGRDERLASVLASAALLLLGLSRLSWSTVATAAGAYLLYRGTAGRCLIYEALDINRAIGMPGGNGHLAVRPRESSLTGLTVGNGDKVSEASWESFPASDPPGWPAGGNEVGA